MNKSTLMKYRKSDLLERVDNRPVYFHSARCTGGCEYSCNDKDGKGEEIAEQVAELEKQLNAPEEKRLHKAVDDFAASMKARLTEKLEEGYAGWDKPDVISNDKLRHEICHDASSTDKFVDIANFAMMLWFRK